MAGAAGAAGPRSRSSSVIRPLRPLPVTRERSIPSSRARRRTDGLAYTGTPPSTGDAGPGAGTPRERGPSASSAVTIESGDAASFGTPSDAIAAAFDNGPLISSSDEGSIVSSSVP